MRSRLRVGWVLAAALLLVPSLLHAQKGDWQSLASIRPKSQVQVIDRKLRTYKGKFVAFTNAGITLIEDKQEKTIAREDVYRVTLVGAKRLRNVLIGLAIGAAAGAGTGAALMERESGYGGAVAGTVVGLGGLGAGIGALVPGNKTVYESTLPPAG